jgi:glycosyltransferase involved in cell wall biosynthesis
VSAPIRVCLITSKHTIRDSRVFGGFYAGIERAGGEPTIIGPSPDEHRDEPRSIRLPVRASANQDTLANPRLMYERTRALAYLLWWCLRLRPDIVQACDPDSWVVAWLAARLYGGRAVFDVHEMFPAHLAGRLPARWRRAGEATLLRLFGWLLRRGDAVFHVSEARKRYYGLSGDRHVAVPSYPSLTVADHARAVDERTLDVVHLGPVVEPASRRALVEALEHCRAAGRPLAVLVVGQTRDEFAGGLPSGLAAMLDERIQFAEPLPHRQALEVAATARIGLALYDSATAARNIVASRKLFEYMALGLGIVGSRVPGVSEVVEGYDVGVVVPLDAGELGRAMLDLVRDTTRLERCAAVGQAAFRRELNWEVQSARVMSIYDSLLRERRAS